MKRCVFHSSHPGMRKEQQDSSVALYGPVEETYFLVVCDGAGGQKGGKLASDTVTTVASEFWHTEHEVAMRDPQQYLNAFALRAHQRVNEANAEGNTTGRTTMVALLALGDRACWSHCGDSRLYCFHSGNQVFRTRDHSMAEREGGLPVKASAKRQARVLKGLGGPRLHTPDIDSCVLEPGHAFLLCSDGFWGNMESRDLEGIFQSNDANAIQRSAGNALQAAVERGGDRADNATICVLGPLR